MANIRTVSTSSVHATNNCKNNEANQIIQLTPCDLKLILVGPIQKGLLFYKPNCQTNPLDQSFIQHLETSLSRTLDFFPSLAGRLVRLHHDDNTVSFSIHCNNAGALFVHAVADGVTVSDILKPLYVPSMVHSFFPLNRTINCDGVTVPLLGVQVTELVDGFFIGCTVNHSIADGTSFWSFFSSWSRISCDLHHIPKSPIFDFSCLENEHFPIRIPLSLMQKGNTEFVLPKLLERVFHYKKEAISGLKAKANEEAGFVNNISSLQSLLAHIWGSVIRASPHVKPEQEHCMSLAIGLRSRLNPPLADNYFGNAILYVRTASVKAGEMLQRGLGYAALQVNNVVASHREDKIRADLESWIQNPQLKALGELISNSIGISSSPRFDVYGNDFGWGRPVAVRSGAGNKFDGKITLFPGVEEGSVDVEVCVVPETLHAMESDSEFMATVCADYHQS